MRETDYKIKELETLEQNSIRCVIIDGREENVYGTISLEGIDFENRSAELKVREGNISLLHEMGVEAINQMLYHAFKNMHFQRIEGVVAESCKAITGMYEAAGFVREGIKRSGIYQNGRFENGILYSILQDEYSGCCEEHRVALADYCMKKASSLEEKTSVIKTCENAFSNHASLNLLDKKLVRKIDALAEFLVAYNSEILGYAAIYANDIENEIAYITLIAVRPEYQKKNIGSRLMQSCIKIAKQRGMKGIKLEVKNSNKGAISFYERWGFKFLSACTADSSYLYLELQ